MSSLADAFPEAWREDHAVRQVQVGAVIRTWVANTTPPKIKRWIVVAQTADMLLLGVVYVNTDINPNVFPSEELRRLQVQLQPDERGLFDHTCYADCSKLQPMPLTVAQKQLAEDPTCLLGHMEGHELGKLQQTAAGARTISKHEKKKFGLL